MEHSDDCFPYFAGNLSWVMQWESKSAKRMIGCRCKIESEDTSSALMWPWPWLTGGKLLGCLDFLSKSSLEALAYAPEINIWPKCAGNKL